MSGRRKVNPYLKIALGFFVIIIVGAILLTMPFATTGENIGLVDALFTSASAVCVTGLSVLEVGAQLTFFGQLVLLLLIQIGGLGFMTVTAMLFIAIGKRIGIADRIALQEALNKFELDGVVGMTKKAVKLTFLFEGAGFVLLLVPMIAKYGAKGIWISAFHSVSAFCNAGFDILGNGNSIADFSSDPYVLVITMLLIIAGGLGFFVMLDIGRKRKKKGLSGLSLQTKIVITVNTAMILFGAIVFIAAEWSNPLTIGNMSVADKIFCGTFQAVSPRTAGFAVFGQGNMQSVSMFTTLLYMFIGASPAGTGGGIKTTTFAILLVLVVQIIKGKSDTVIFKKRISHSTVLKAIGITALSIIFVAVCTLLISAFENGRIDGTDIVFETVSAFATVGLSCGITAELCLASKLVVILMMFGGRVGLMSLAFAISGRFANEQTKIAYPQEKIMIG